jgi:oxalate decarboxylase/phosphoglucose isomerase-like protein (cupin superfamily)
MQVLIRESRGAATPLHTHQDSDETFYVIAGAVTAVVDDERFEAGPGDFLYAPMGVPHAWIVTSETAEILVTAAAAGARGPAGYGADGFFREVGTPVVDGEAAPDPAMPDPRDFARRMAEYRVDLAGPPPPSLD